VNGRRQDTEKHRHASPPEDLPTGIPCPVVGWHAQRRGSRHPTCLLDLALCCGLAISLAVVSLRRLGGAVHNVTDVKLSGRDSQRA